MSSRKAHDHDALSEYAGCEGKAAFATASRAYLVGRRMTKKGRPVQKYKCSRCHGYHLGGNYLGKVEMPVAKRAKVSQAKLQQRLDVARELMDSFFGNGLERSK